MGQKIDIVIPWVDGKDAGWQLEKEKYKTPYATYAHNGITRYRDMNLMRYWFRGIEKNAPWVHKIHFLTWGHLPAWLDTAHPKLHIVKHSDYIPAEYLPTFSSHAIELNIHRIQELSETFIYFNDDTFLIGPVKERDYFVKELPCDEIKRSEHLFSSGQNSFFAHIPFNNMCIVNRHFDKKNKRCFQNHWLSFRYPFKVNLENLIDVMPFGYGKCFQRFHDFHIPIPLLKSMLNEIWVCEGKILNETCMHKFRSPLDVNIWLVRYFQLASGKFVPQNVQKRGQCFTLKKDNAKLYDALRNRRVPTVCINDAATYENDFNFDVVTQELREIFESLYPQKSSFEKETANGIPRSFPAGKGEARQHVQR